MWTDNFERNRKAPTWSGLIISQCRTRAHVSFVWNTNSNFRLKLNYRNANNVGLQCDNTSVKRSPKRYPVWNAPAPPRGTLHVRARSVYTNNTFSTRHRDVGTRNSVTLGGGFKRRAKGHVLPHPLGRISLDKCFQTAISQ